RHGHRIANGGGASISGAAAGYQGGVGSARNGGRARYSAEVVASVTASSAARLALNRDGC
ncbi:MAG: hypothetical protein AAGC80_02845, partial [Rhodococcus sp. (in: high G+C Gram-positive bacteria)]